MTDDRRNTSDPTGGAPTDQTLAPSLAAMAQDLVASLERIELVAGPWVLGLARRLAERVLDRDQAPSGGTCAIGHVAPGPARGLRESQRHELQVLAGRLEDLASFYPTGNHYKAAREALAVVRRLLEEGEAAGGYGIRRHGHQAWRIEAMGQAAVVHEDDYPELVDQGPEGVLALLLAGFLADCERKRAHEDGPGIRSPAPGVWVVRAGTRTETLTVEDFPELEGVGAGRVLDLVKADATPDGVLRIAHERARQLRKGWTPRHDLDEHSEDEDLARAGAFLAYPVDLSTELQGQVPGWAHRHRRTNGRIRHLEIAGALIAAELDRQLLEDAPHRGPPDGPELEQVSQGERTLRLGDTEIGTVSEALRKLEELEAGRPLELEAPRGRVHELKIWPFHHEALIDGRKRVEIRRDDRGFQAGDRLRLREWTPLRGYTGQELEAEVTHLIRGPWLAPGHVAMSVRLLSWSETGAAPTPAQDETGAAPEANPGPMTQAEVDAGRFRFSIPVSLPLAGHGPDWTAAQEAAFRTWLEEGRTTAPGAPLGSVTFPDAREAVITGIRDYLGADLPGPPELDSGSTAALARARRGAPGPWTEELGPFELTADERIYVTDWIGQVDRMGGGPRAIRQTLIAGLASVWRRRHPSDRRQVLEARVVGDLDRHEIVAYYVTVGIDHGEE